LVELPAQAATGSKPVVTGARILQASELRGIESTQPQFGADGAPISHRLRIEPAPARQRPTLINRIPEPPAIAPHPHAPHEDSRPGQRPHAPHPSIADARSSTSDVISVFPAIEDSAPRDLSAPSPAQAPARAAAPWSVDPARLARTLQRLREARRPAYVTAHVLQVTAFAVAGVGALGSIAAMVVGFVDGRGAAALATGLEGVAASALLGLLLYASGHLLQANTDTAVNSAALLEVLKKAEH